MRTIEQQAEAHMNTTIHRYAEDWIKREIVKTFIAGSKATESAGVWRDDLPDDKSDYHLMVEGEKHLGWYSKDLNRWLTDYDQSFSPEVVKWLDPSASPSPSLLQQENERLVAEVERLKGEIDKNYKGYKFKP